MLEKLRGVLQARDVKKLLESLFSLGGLEMIGYIFPLITMPYLSYTIGIDRFGNLALAVAVVEYFRILVDWGYNFGATQAVARCRENRDAVSRIYSEVFWGRLMLICLSLVVLIILILVIPRLQLIALPLLFRFLMILGYWLYADWLFQGLEEMRYITILNLCSSLVFTGSVFVFIKSPEDYIYHPLLLSLGFVIAGLISFFIIIPRKGIRLHLTPLKDILCSLRGSADIFFNQAITVYFDNVVVLLLGLWHPTKASGLLDAGMKPAYVIRRFTSILSRAFYPLLARRIDKHSFFVIIALSLAFIFSLGTFLGAPIIVDILFSKEFNQAVIALRIISPFIFFSMLINVYGINYLVQIGQERCLRNTTIVGSVLSVIIAVPLIYYYAWVGGATALLISKAILGILIMLQGLKNKKQRLERSR